MSHTCRPGNGRCIGCELAALLNSFNGTGLAVGDFVGAVVNLIAQTLVELDDADRAEIEAKLPEMIRHEFEREMRPDRLAQRSARRGMRLQ